MGDMHRLPHGNRPEMLGAYASRTTKGDPGAHHLGPLCQQDRDGGGQRVPEDGRLPRRVRSRLSRGARSWDSGYGAVGPVTMRCQANVRFWLLYPLTFPLEAVRPDC